VLDVLFSEGMDEKMALELVAPRETGGGNSVKDVDREEIFARFFTGSIVDGSLFSASWEDACPQDVEINKFVKINKIKDKFEIFINDPKIVVLFILLFTFAFQ